MYLVGYYKDGIREGYLHAGRPCTIRVYESVESANRGIKQNSRYYSSAYELKVEKITSTEVVE